MQKRKEKNTNMIMLKCKYAKNKKVQQKTERHF